MSSAHDQWMAAWEATVDLPDELRAELQAKLSSVSGELKIGPQAVSVTRRRSLALIREVHRQAKATA
jgi:hypothetical protein